MELGIGIPIYKLTSVDISIANRRDIEAGSGCLLFKKILLFFFPENFVFLLLKIGVFFRSFFFSLANLMRVDECGMGGNDYYYGCLLSAKLWRRDGHYTYIFTDVRVRKIIYVYIVYYIVFIYTPSYKTESLKRQFLRKTIRIKSWSYAICRF